MKWLDNGHKKHNERGSLDLEIRDMSHIQSGHNKFLKNSLLQIDRGQKQHSRHRVGTLFKTNEVINEKDTQFQRNFPSFLQSSYFEVEDYEVLRTMEVSMEGCTLQNFS